LDLKNSLTLDHAKRMPNTIMTSVRKKKLFWIWLRGSNCIQDFDF